MDRTRDDQVILYFADDGENICNLIFASSKTFKYTVRRQNICDKQYPEKCQAFILVLTPEMLEELEIRPKHFLKGMTSESRSQAMIYHDAVDVENSHTRRVLEDQCPESLSWKCFRTGKSDEEFKQTCFQIFTLADTNKPFQVPMLVNFKLTPKEVWTAKDEIVVTLKRPINEGQISVYLRNQEGISKAVQLSKLNDTAYKFNSEGMPEGDIAVEVFVDNLSLGKTSFTIRSKMQVLSDLMDDVINPVDFICSTLNTDNTETLDLILCEKFTNYKTNRIPMFAIENYQEENSKVFDVSVTEYPTILHFAAKYGLCRLCEVLMKYPGYRTAKVMKDRSGKTPSQVAFLAGHKSLSETIQNTDSATDYEEIAITDEADDSDYLTYDTTEQGRRHSISRSETPGNVQMRSQPLKCPGRDSGIQGSGDTGSGGSFRRPRSGSRLSLLENERLSLPGNVTDDWS